MAAVARGEALSLKNLFTDASITSRPGLLPIDTGEIDLKVNYFHARKD